jgi:hypothetical protein
MNKTTVLAFGLDEASAKIRSRMPVDEEEDRGLPAFIIIPGVD